MKNRKILNYILSALVIALVASLAVFAADDDFTATNFLSDTEKCETVYEKISTMGIVSDDESLMTVAEGEVITIAAKSGSVSYESTNGSMHIKVVEDAENKTNNKVYVVLEDETERLIEKTEAAYIMSKDNVMRLVTRYGEITLCNFANDDYELWAQEDSGEVAIRIKATGQIITTNPYDASASTATETIKEQLLSQIVLQYEDGSGQIADFNSYRDASLNGKKIKNRNVNQITVSPMRNGIRVDYTLGKEQAKYVLPKQIERSSFEKNIIEPWADKSARDYKVFVSYYDLKDPFDTTQPSSVITSMKNQFPATEEYAIYVLDPGVSNRELEMLAGYLENNTSYDENQMAADYDKIDYIDTSAAPAIFRFAIEYVLDDNGLKISVPANSITYDSATYKLKNVKLLPYLGAGNGNYTGFTFLPDGSGTITRFEDVTDAFTLTGKVYGKDFAYHAISGYNQETIRIPAIGVVQYTPIPGEDGKIAKDNPQTIGEGFVAYFEEGASLLELSANHGGNIHPYNSTYATFFPKDSDTYTISGISSEGDTQWTIHSDRRYTGSYAMRLLPVYGEDVDYVDMAKEVRTYLESTGVLTKMTAESDKSKDVSLYIENFGTIETDEKVVGFPVKMQTPLTTFDQTKNMVNDLASRNITNVNVKLTGWYNGGMEHEAPSYLEVEDEVGGMDGLQSLAKFAKKKNIGLYPDLDYTYVGNFGWFDGFDESDDLAQTIDERVAEHRVYNALYQGFEADEKNIISSGSMKKLYKQIKDDYKSIGASGISVATVGSDLNSNHNEEFMINRDESEKFVMDFLSYLKKTNGSVMVNGGNAYTYAYADHILGVPLDSSMNVKTSLSVPFMGMVLHGYTEFAGTPINLDGDFDYSVLKAVENGANLYFMVSKDNTTKLKAFPEFSKYYAIDYDNWANDIQSTYAVFNEVMSDVKYSAIVDHKKLKTRIISVTYEDGTEFVLDYNTNVITANCADGTQKVADLKTNIVNIKNADGTEKIINYSTEAVTLDDETKIEAMGFIVR